MPQRNSRHLFGGAHPGANGPDPGAEGGPDELRKRGRKVVEQPLSNEADLDVPVVGVDLPADGVSVRAALSVEKLVSRTASSGGHRLHPEVVRVGAEGMDSLLERDLDLEP